MSSTEKPPRARKRSSQIGEHARPSIALEISRVCEPIAARSVRRAGFASPRRSQDATGQRGWRTRSEATLPFLI